MRCSILFGGKAGQGPNILTNILGRALVRMGYYVFYSRDYQSLIRGGHNFNVLTFSDEPANSNDFKIDVIVALDANTEMRHRDELKKDGIVLKDSKMNMFYAGRIFKLLGFDFNVLDNELKLLKRRYEENILEAKKGYDFEKSKYKIFKSPNKKNVFMNGNQGLSTGAVNSGLDVYFAYPMTPSTPVLGELAKNQIEKNYVVLELEGEIAIVNAGIGASITGAKTMVGTSGGGFDLMSEGLSLAGIAGAPLVMYLAQRPGPATGIPTYNSQGDLQMARHTGHGEFPRLVLAPGDPREAEEMTNQAFYFSQKYKVPSIIIGDKHLAESFYSLSEKAKIVPVPKSTNFGRYNSYEKDPKTGSSTEDPNIINANVEARLKKELDIEKESKKFSRYEIYGKKNAKDVIVSWGSTKGAIIDSINGANIKFVQIKYIEPFPKDVLIELKNKNVILVENNSKGQLGDVIREKTGFEIKNKILRYDGRPFLRDELSLQIKSMVGGRL